MSSFSECMQSNPPRLVLRHSLDPNGVDQFDWGVVHHVPLMSLIGAVVAVQDKIVEFDAGYIDPCDEPALVVAFDREGREYDLFIHESIPKLPMLGMLELVKQMLVAAKMGQNAAESRTGLVDKEGRPILRGK